MTISPDSKYEQIQNLKFHLFSFTISYSPIISFTKINCIPFSRFKHFIVLFWWIPRHTNFTWNVSQNVFDNIAFILVYSTLFCKFIRPPLCLSAWFLTIPFNALSHLLPEKLFADPNFSMFWGILAKICIFGKFHPQPSSLGKHSFIRLMRLPRVIKDWRICDRGCGSFTQYLNNKYSFRQFLNLFKEIFLSFVSFHINFCPECVCITKVTQSSYQLFQHYTFLVPSVIPLRMDMHGKSLSFCCYDPYYGTQDMCTKAQYKDQYVQGA